MSRIVAHELVDEWRLMVYPIVVGKGKRCFGDPGRAVDMRLVDARTVGEGIAILIYEPAPRLTAHVAAYPKELTLARTQPRGDPRADHRGVQRRRSRRVRVELLEEHAATIVPPDGRRVSGRDAIRAALEPIFAQRPSARIDVVGKLQADGLALTQAGPPRVNDCSALTPAPRQRELAE
jgi:hypothetical protein